MTKSVAKKPESQNELVALNSEQNENESKDCDGTCQECKKKTKAPKAKKANKPMYKLGCWSGTFQGTPDF